MGKYTIMLINNSSTVPISLLVCIYTNTLADEGVFIRLAMWWLSGQGDISNRPGITRLVVHLTLRLLFFPTHTMSESIIKKADRLYTRGTVHG